MREHGLYIFVFSAVYRWPSRSIRQMDVPWGGGGFNELFAQLAARCSRIREYRIRLGVHRRFACWRSIREIISRPNLRLLRSVVKSYGSMISIRFVSVVVRGSRFPSHTRLRHCKLHRKCRFWEWLSPTRDFLWIILSIEVKRTKYYLFYGNK